jgi:hypothetical protein
MEKVVNTRGGAVLVLAERFFFSGGLYREEILFPEASTEGPSTW